VSGVTVCRAVVGTAVVRPSTCSAVSGHTGGNVNESKSNAREIRGFTDEAMRSLLTHPWPGNVRELENALGRAVVLRTEELVGAMAERSDHEGAGA
jgi:hypothetical protein